MNGKQSKTVTQNYSLIIHDIQDRKNINVIETWFPGWQENKSLNKEITFGKIK